MEGESLSKENASMIVLNISDVFLHKFCFLTVNIGIFTYFPHPMC